MPLLNLSMEEHEKSVVLCITNPPLKPAESSSKSCEECRTNKSKYKCPGCSVRSCSLPCVKAHKQRTGCTGKRRQQTEFVPLSQFDDNLLLSDYNMLEDVKRIADSAKRMRIQVCGKFLHGIPFHLRNLLKAAHNRRIKLLYLPSGMSKRETNQTYYNNRSKFISWTIEWQFHSTNVKLMDHGVHENSNLFSLIENHLKPGPRNYPLKPFCLEPLESLRFFISKHPKRSRSPFRELDINAPICEQFANLIIVEYPVIHVFLPSHTLDFEVVKDLIALRAQSKMDPVNKSQPNHTLDFKAVKDPITHRTQPNTDPVNKSQPSPIHTLDFKVFKDPIPHQAQPKTNPVNKSQSSSIPTLGVEVIKDPIPQRARPKTDPVNESQLSPKGVFFREEEFKDDNSTPHVLDLMNQSNDQKETKDEEFIHESLDSTNYDNELGVVNLYDFDFDPEFIDAYSNLISETNPDDFLDLDGFLCHDKREVIKEELEEGEIADSD